ncbi:MAG: type ISP restriction/modification enzyme [Bacteroidota bacterium]
MTVQDYIDKLNTRFKTGISREHSYRGDLQNLLENIATDVLVTNEPARIACGAPDYIITKKNIPIGYIEAKDIGAELNSKSHKEQFDRYRLSLNNLIITDYLTFQLFCDGVLVNTISIGQIQGNKIIGLPDNYSNFISFIKDFCSYTGQTIKSSKKLAEMMAGKARLLSDIIEKALNSDEENQENSTLNDQLTAFKNILIHDIKPKEFADVYAQTIAYGMFAARLHDPTLDSFSRQEAAELIPKSNPFLRKLFGYIAGPDIDDRIKWVVDSLVEVFLACNVKDLLKDYGKATKMEDPIIHFYETFLSEYDAALRKARGVWYTPHPVVSFQVRAIDEILKTEFDLPQGIADSSKIKIKVDIQGKMIEQEVHRVQILDPTTGTGTYIAEVIKEIYKKFEGQQGIWSSYVENHLLPRLIGFELLMASYAMAHLQIDLLLTETGFIPSKEQRLKIYLTNSLEESHPDTGSLFANWLSNEANEANRIKRSIPVMVVVGNPPYAVSSSNKGKWIQNLIADYKVDLHERKINLDDDYIKFIRLGQHLIDKNGSGILTFITNNSFIDGITHRQMRKHLLESFDKIYILDLHGNSRKKEVCSDGSTDQNVFDIMQGVSINIFIKTGKKKKNELGKVFHYELQGKREFKYDNLNNNNLKSFPWVNLKYTKPNYFFVPKDFDEIKRYEEGFSIDTLFEIYTSGMQTKRDKLCISFNLNEINDKFNYIRNNEIEDIRRKFDLKEDGRDWTIKDAKKDIESNEGNIEDVLYRPFDIRKTYFSGKTKGFIAYPRREKMVNFINKNNYGLIVPRMCKGERGFEHGLISKKIIDIAAGDAYSGIGTFFFPLYIYKEEKPKVISSSVKEYTLFSGYKEYDEDNLSVVEEPKLVDRSFPYRPNLSQTILRGIEKSSGLLFVLQVKKTSIDEFGEVDLLDYIYAVLHSPTYREKYKEFLKIDFPRVPYPKDNEIFWQLVKLGGELRQIHLLESPIVEKYITKYPIDGDNVVGKLKYQDNNVYINETQYFANVPEVAWSFYIGGYQPAQKWLKDRKERKLEFEDILHYQKIIVALSETDRIMKEIDKIDIE